MNRLAAYVAACLVTLSLAAAFAPALAAPGPLDGKTFKGDSGPVGKPADVTGDVLTFRDGAFHSSACDKWQFATAAYTTTGSGNTIAFESETVSPTEGVIKWKGVFNGATLEGKFTHLRKPVWYRPNPEPVEYWFRATQQ
jgi:hypothetical protein